MKYIILLLTIFSFASCTSKSANNAELGYKTITVLLPNNTPTTVNVKKDLHLVKGDNLWVYTLKNSNTYVVDYAYSLDKSVLGRIKVTIR